MSKHAAAALIALVVQNTALVILLKFSFREHAPPYAPTTVVLTTEIVKLVGCGMVVFCQSAERLTASILTISRRPALFIPSLLYVLQNNLLFYGAKRLSPVVYIVCAQTKTLSTAFASRILLGTRLNRNQYLSLALLVIGVALVQDQSTRATATVSNASSGGGIDDKLYGIFAVLLASLTSGTAGVVLERIFKEPNAPSVKSELEHSIWTRNVQLGLISLPFAFIGVLSQAEHVMKHDFFYGYDVVVWCVVLLQAAGGVIIAFVMKFASNILKCVAIALSICCCAIYSLSSGDIQFTVPLLIGICLVNVSAAAYTICSAKSVPSSVNSRQEL